MTQFDTDNSTTNVCIEVLADSTINNLTTVIQNAIIDALDLDTESVEDAVDSVITGISPPQETDAISDAVAELGLDTDWTSDEFNVFQPNVEPVREKITPELFDSTDALERRAYREATDLRNKTLADSPRSSVSVDAFILITDDVTDSTVHGLTASANAFIDSVISHGRADDLFAAYVGVPDEENAPLEGSSPPEDNNNVFLGEKVTVSHPPTDDLHDSQSDTTTPPVSTVTVHPAPGF